MLLSRDSSESTLLTGDFTYVADFTRVIHSDWIFLYGMFFFSNLFLLIFIFFLFFLLLLFFYSLDTSLKAALREDFRLAPAEDCWAFGPQSVADLGQAFGTFVPGPPHLASNTKVKTKDYYKSKTATSKFGLNTYSLSGKKKSFPGLPFFSMVQLLAYKRPPHPPPPHPPTNPAPPRLTNSITVGFGSFNSRIELRMSIFAILQGTVGIMREFCTNFYNSQGHTNLSVYDRLSILCHSHILLIPANNGE